VKTRLPGLSVVVACRRCLSIDLCLSSLLTLSSVVTISTTDKLEKTSPSGYSVSLIVETVSFCERLNWFFFWKHQQSINCFIVDTSMSKWFRPGAVKIITSTTRTDVAERPPLLSTLVGLDGGNDFCLRFVLRLRQWLAMHWWSMWGLDLAFVQASPENSMHRCHIPLSSFGSSVL
jgi:hypothetical protein